MKAKFPRSPFFVFAALCALVPLPRFAAAGTGADAPVSLVLYYQCPPARRAAFRAFLAGPGAGQFAAWKNAGVFAGDTLLFSALANRDAWDAAVILRFNHFTDLARWREIERAHPGGLSAAGLALGSPAGAWTAGVVARGAAAKRDPAQGVYLVIPYALEVDAAQYENYATGYIVPQMDGWMKAGVLSSYALYLNQNAGGPWDALLVLEYNGLAGLARRDAVKAEVRAALAKDPAWRFISNDKSGIRRELAPVLADPLAPPAP